MRMAVGDLESTNTAGFRATSKRNMELSWFLNLATCRWDFFGGKDVSCIRHGMSVRRSSVRRLSIKDVIERRGCITAKTMSDNCQAKSRRKDLGSCSACPGRNIMILAWAIAERLTETALTEM